VTSGAKIIALLALASAGLLLGGTHGAGLVTSIVETPSVSWAARRRARSPGVLS
jgi:hypothetical protein